MKRRTLLVATFSTFAASVFMTVRKVLEFAGAPVGEKQSDFVFPRPAQPAVARVATPADSTIPFAQRGGFINDASHLNRTGVYGIVNIGNEADVRNALQFAHTRGGGLKVTAAGQRHSMGGQTFVQNGLVLDMHGLHRITIDAAARTVNVQSGAVWADVQRALDAQGLSVKAMQSINIFTVGGTLSVNAHGIAHDPGPIAPTVKSLRVMLTNGEIKTASPSINPDLFRHVLGGYGLCGVILDVDLDVVANEMYERHTTYMDYRDFTDFYKRHVDGNPAVGLVYGRLSVSPSSYLREGAIHVYQRTPYSGALPALVPDSHDALQRFVINVSKTGAMGRRLRWILEKNVEPRIHACTGDGVCLVSRNQEMYDSMHYLQNRLPDTDILQEYFIPYDRMGEFVDGLRTVVQRTGANLLNVTIRIVHHDTVTALPYAKQDMFGFVLYFNQGFNEPQSRVLEQTTRELIDVALAAGGTFYLPYQLFYSPAQLRQAYPEIDRHFAAKRKYDPIGLLSNTFYQKYGGG